jgi:SAM-dependent methyltransferase
MAWMRRLIARAERPALPAFPGWKVRSQDEAHGLRDQLWGEHSPVAACERKKAASGSVRGFSAPAGQTVEFEVHRGDAGEVNWRETLVCPVTGLSNRLRAAFHLFISECLPDRKARLFITEQTTPFYRHMRGLFPRTIGSEYSPSRTLGKVDKKGIRNEDLTRLTFASQYFDAILTFDVLEHVPDYVAALSECARVLKPGGRIYITVPFTYAPPTVVRARRLPDGTVEHLLPPEYHGDPVGTGGILCYYHFGYDFLDAMRSAGFSDAYVCFSSSVEFGYFGVQAIIVGVR